MREQLYLVKILSREEPRLDYGGYSSCGLIGEATGVVDTNDEMICIGDMVKITYPCGRWWSNLIVQLDKVDKARYTDELYYTINGVASDTLDSICVKNKVERVMPYEHINYEYRRHVHYIALSEKYLDTCYDFIDGVWTKVSQI